MESLSYRFVDEGCINCCAVAIQKFRVTPIEVFLQK